MSPAIGTEVQLSLLDPCPRTWQNGTRLSSGKVKHAQELEMGNEATVCMGMRLLYGNETTVCMGIRLL